MRLSAKVFGRLGAVLEELWIALFAWIPTPLGVLARLFAWRPFFRACGSARFSVSLTVIGMKNIALGNGVRVGRGSFLTASRGSLTIGDNSAVSPNVNIGADDGEILIGGGVAIGPGTVIRAANHRYDSLDKPIINQGHSPGKVVIEDDVWIGANCVLTPDTRVGRGAIVGAGAVVTRNVAPFTIVGGVPARVIGRRD